MDIVNVLLSILGIGFLIFIHELGHFIAAKRVGIRVETFAIGFQPTIFGWRARLLAVQRGDTEYVIGLVPFGGYVKMAGEELEDPRTGSDDEYASKSPSQRALVLVAGATMNLIFGFLLFMLAFSMGVSFPSTTIGKVFPEDPAWEAGIRPGDKILSIDGDPKRDFTNLQTSIALSSKDRDLEVTLERPKAGGGAPEIVTTKVRPKLDPGRGLLGIGITPATGATIQGLVEGSPADRAGLQTGDEIRALSFLWGQGNRYDVPKEWVFDRVIFALAQFVNSARDGVVELVVIRGDGDGATEITAKVAIKATIPEKGAPKLGVQRSMRRIASVLPGSGLESALPVHAIVTAVGGNPVPSFDLWSVLENSAPSDATVRIGFSDGSESTVPRELILAALSDEYGSIVRVTPVAPVVRSVEAGSVAAKLGIEVGDEILTVGNLVTQSVMTEADLLEPETPITWRRAGRIQTASTSSDEAEPFGAVLARAPEVGHVAQGSAADRAGLLRGDQITLVGEKEILSWRSLLVSIEAAGKEDPPVPLRLTIVRDGTEQQIDVTPAPHANSLGLSFAAEQFELKTSFVGGIAEGWDQSVVWGQRIFLMLGSLARRDVAPKNLAGPIGIVHIGKRVAEEGLSKLFFVLAMISINLGVFNLLPFPILDGGHLFFLLIEKIKGSPVDENIQGWVHLGAFLILISLGLYVTYHDILRLGG